MEIADAHNAYRRAVNASIPDLAYSISLEAGAQIHADYLAANLLFQHSSGSGFGENIWMGGIGRTPTNMISGFGNEKQYFKYGLFPDSVSTTGSWFAVGHYTQIIWRNTKSVGCAVANASNGSARYVCRYDPPGNYVGQYVY